MAEAKKKEVVVMYGSGNYIIDKTIYVFRDGEEVEVKIKKHKSLLEAEAKRRKAVYDKRVLLGNTDKQ